MNNSSGYEGIADLMDRIAIPDLVVPAQYADMRRATALSPERALMLAVLEDALECYQAKIVPASKPRKVYQALDAYQWIFLEDIDHVMSFESICTALHIDPEYLREKLAREKPFDRESLRNYFHDPLWAKARARKPAGGALKPRRDTKTQMLALAS